MSKRQSKAGRGKDSRNQLSEQDRELISKALNLVSKELDKRMDKLTDADMILFITKLAPYGWAEAIAETDTGDNNNHVAKNPDRHYAKPKSNRSEKKMSAGDLDVIKDALRIMVNTLCKKIDRLSNKNLILFLALLAKYNRSADTDSGEDIIREFTIGVAA